MNNKYVSFLSDEHLLKCIENLYNSYEKAKNNLTQTKFYSNKIDTFKLIFDSKFNDLDEEDLIKAELSRQIDKSVSNAIGTFQEEVLGGIEGYERGILSGYDIKASNNTLFADIKNKHNTMNSSASESLFQKLIRFADDNEEAKCYLVQMFSTSSYNEPWVASYSKRNYAHERVYKISGDQFYKLLTGIDDAFYKLYKVLPEAIRDFLSTIEGHVEEGDSVLDEIKIEIANSDRTIIDQITFDNYSYYFGFADLNNKVIEEKQIKIKEY